MSQYELNIRDYLRILRKRRTVILLTFIAVMISGVSYVSTRPVFYQASTTVKIEERKTIAGMLTEWIAYNPGDIMESQTKVIKGYPVMKDVALSMGLIDKTTPLEKANVIISSLQGNTTTEKVGQTNMIRITATSNDAKNAMDLVNKIAAVYIEQNLMEKTEQFRHARQFIEDQLSSLEARLKETEERLKNFGDEVKNIKLAEPIEKRLVDLQFELSELLQKYTERHPRVIQIKEQIKEMEHQVKGFSGQELEYARLSREVEVNKKLYAMLKEKLEEARITEAQKVGDVSVVDPAVMPGSPISADKKTGVLVSGLMGLIIGVAFAFILETLDTSISTIEDVENVLKLPVLGVVSTIHREIGSKRKGIFSSIEAKIFPPPRDAVQERNAYLLSHYKPKSLTAEAFRTIRTNLKLDPTKKTFIVTSSNPREGKTTVVTNLGIVMAQTGMKVLLVSTDLRRPALAKVFGLKREPGINELLSGAAGLDEALRNITDVMLGDIKLDDIISHPPGLENIWILPSGKIVANPAELLELKEMTALIEEFKRRFDVIIFDTPPVLPVTDASLLAPKTDGAIIVYEIGTTSREALQRTKVQLETVGAKIFGVILNNTRANTESVVNYPYYKYRYKYYGKDESEKEEKTEKKEG